MDNPEFSHITVVIAGRPYPLKVQAEDEAAIRKIVKEVNDRVNTFQLTYTHKDKQDCLAMALLTYAVDLFKSTQSEDGQALLAARLSRVETLLDDLLR
jgi:cell division protein ZapA (FtsZ GTPase activity inhibitor)